MVAGTAPAVNDLGDSLHHDVVQFPRTRDGPDTSYEQ
jgi:hypothetical protein